MADACRPTKTWFGRRKQCSTIAIAALVFTLALLSQPDWRADLFKPGDLSTAHAQILSGTLTSDRCASCHPQAATSPIAWFASGLSGHDAVSQSDRCLNCHHITIDRSVATLAHNLPQSTRNEIRLASLGSTRDSWHDWMPSPSINQENIQCNACHREHGGPGNDLSAVSDQQCQTCHSDRFGSFASSHPEWDRWPYGRGRNVAFNHASHANQHFPATKQGNGTAQFQCADCHHKTSGNELTRVTTFERGCQSCHQKGLKVEVAEGIDLFALPTLPTEVANRVGRWPQNATGFYDGRIGAITELLLRSNAETERSIREIPNGDFGQIDASNDRAVAAAEQIAIAYRSLIEQVAEEGQVAIVDRIAATGVTRSTAGAFVHALSPQLVARASKQWFDGLAELSSFDPRPRYSFALPTLAKPADDLLEDDDLLGDDDLLETDDLLEDGDLLGDADPLVTDPLAADPLAAPNDDTNHNRSSKFDADKMLPHGGWYRDELRLAIRYRGGGHADPVLKSAIDMISQLPTTDPVHKRLLTNQAVAACVACHPGAVQRTDGWKSEPKIGSKREFTKFAHGPHLNIANLADCIHCHQIGIESNDGVTNLEPTAQAALIEATAVAANEPGPSVFGSPVLTDPHDFAPMNRATCASCHTPQAAGDACIKCHRYHIDVR